MFYDQVRISFPLSRIKDNVFCLSLRDDFPPFLKTTSLTVCRYIFCCGRVSLRMMFVRGVFSSESCLLFMNRICFYGSLKSFNSLFHIRTSDYRSPFSAEARKKTGKIHNGGKADDITVICAWVVKESDLSRLTEQAGRTRATMTASQWWRERSGKDESQTLRAGSPRSRPDPHSSAPFCWSSATVM